MLASCTKPMSAASLTNNFYITEIRFLTMNFSSDMKLFNSFSHYSKKQRKESEKYISDVKLRLASYFKGLFSATTSWWDKKNNARYSKINTLFETA